MLTRIGQWLGGSGTRLPGGDSHWSPDWLASAGLPPTRGAVDPKELAAALRCAAILSDALASAPPNVSAPLVGGGRDKLVTDASRALMRTSYTDWETALLASQLGGNGFLHIRRNDRGGAHRLVGIPSRLVSIAIDATGRVLYEIMPDEALGIFEAVIPASDMVHVRARCMDNPLVGVSPLRAAGASIAAVVETVSLQKSMFQNLNTAGLIFGTDLDLSKDQMTQLRAAVDQQTKKLASGGSLILANGLKADRTSNGSTAHDESLIDALEFSVREIARTFGVPPSMLAQASESSYSTAAEERRAFLTSTLQPWAARVASELTAKLLSEVDQTAGHTVAYSFESALMGHGAERAETLSKLVNSGIMSTNEARNLSGLADVEGGDVVRCPVNTYPLPEWLTYGPTPPPEPEPEP
ncbi:MAG: phage portal protein, partial [Pseudoruegeria sp.]